MKLKHDEPLSNFAFKFILCRYSTVVGEMCLSRDTLEAVRRSEFAVSEEDDGFATLSPDLYINFRLNTLIRDYAAETVILADFLFTSRCLVFFFGAAGTCLAGA